MSGCLFVCILFFYYCCCCCYYGFCNRTTVGRGAVKVLKLWGWKVVSSGA